jgi:hypothetical protein
VRFSHCVTNELLVSIVAVHGLNENMIEAWTDPATSILWLRDLLPKAINVARVLTFGYNAYASVAGLPTECSNMPKPL